MSVVSLILYYLKLLSGFQVLPQVKHMTETKSAGDGGKDSYDEVSAFEKKMPKVDVKKA